MRISKSAILASLLASVLATHAEAGTTFAYTSVSVIGDNVTLNDTHTSPNVVNKGVTAGLITLHNGASAMSGYCVDILDSLLGSATFNTGVNPTTNPNLTPSTIATISSLVAHSDGVASDDAAIQIAIWMTEYGSYLTFTGDATDVTTANTYLGYVSSHTWTAPGNQTLVELTPNGSTNQTLVYLVANPVPEPGSLTLFGVALCGLGYVIRRQRAAIV